MADQDHAGAIPQRPLGRTGAKVSALGLGGHHLGDLKTVDEAIRLVHAAVDAGKPITVICHAPWELVSAGLVRGRTLTSYHTLQDDIRNAGGHWVDREVVEDGNWVSSRQPAPTSRHSTGP
jgi:putative intracellular protease/amidase